MKFSPNQADDEQMHDFQSIEHKESLRKPESANFFLFFFFLFFD